MRPADAMQLRALHQAITDATDAMRSANHDFCRYALGLLDNDPTMSITDIARIVGIRQPTMHNKLATFAEKDLTRRTRVGTGQGQVGG